MPKQAIDEALLRKCKKASPVYEGQPAVEAIDERDALLDICAARQEGLGAAARKVTGQ